VDISFAEVKGNCHWHQQLAEQDKRLGGLAPQPGAKSPHYKFPPQGGKGGVYPSERTGNASEARQRQGGIAHTNITLA
jgi:hypothetical protein